MKMTAAYSCNYDCEKMNSYNTCVCSLYVQTNALTYLALTTSGVVVKLSSLPEERAFRKLARTSRTANQSN